VISQLASKYENIVGVKDSGGSIGRISEIIRLVGEKISVLAGTAEVTLSTLMLGGKGAVIAVANVIPKMCSSLYEAFRKGNYDEASRMQKRIFFLNEVLVKRHNQLSAIKEALKLLGLPGGHPRRPALPMEDEEKKDIGNVLKIMLEPF
jgi:4-hydroxy-tetrahydrodipicolinate synthase